MSDEDEYSRADPRRFSGGQQRAFRPRDEEGKFKTKELYYCTIKILKIRREIMYKFPNIYQNDLCSDLWLDLKMLINTMKCFLEEYHLLNLQFHG
mgnify:CR=1 FL=1